MAFARQTLRHVLFTLLVSVTTVVGIGMLTPAPSFAQKKSTKANKAKKAKKMSAINSLIKKGQTFFDEQRYEESIQTLSAALMRPGTSVQARVQVYQLMAYNFIVLQRNEEADGAVRGLLVLDESFVLPDTESPRFRDFFEKVRKGWEKDGKPGLVKGGKTVTSVKVKHIAPDQVDPDAVVSLQGQLDDPKAEVSRMRLYYRTGSSGRFKAAKVKYAMRKFSADIPASAIQPPIVEYYFEGLNKAGLPIASRGDAELPLRIAVADGGSVLESPWFWIPVGATVVAAVVIVAVVASSGGDSTVTVGVFE